MEINFLRSSSCTIAEIDLFLWNSHGREILFFPRNIPLPTSVVFLTVHGTLLTARGRRVFSVSVFYVFSMASNAHDTM